MFMSGLIGLKVFFAEDNYKSRAAVIQYMSYTFKMSLITVQHSPTAIIAGKNNCTIFFQV